MSTIPPTSPLSAESPHALSADTLIVDSPQSADQPLSTIDQAPPTVWSAASTGHADPEFPIRRTTLALALLCVVTGALMVLMGLGITAGGLMQVSICLLCLGAVLVISAVIPTGKKPAHSPSSH